jgi:GTP:adenosylcobinamide-phosphate guanylyltransferase
MADIITGTVSGFVNNTTDQILASVSDVRREAAEHTNEIVKEGIKGDYSTQGAIKDSRHDVINSMSDRFFVIGRDLADVRAQIVQSIADSAMHSEINALKTQKYISEDGEKTRGLINDLKYQDLNRALIERNTELVEERHHGRRWFDNYNQAQWTALNSQVQALNSQFADARQGMVNFGTMAGVGQTSTQNQV